MKIPSTTTEALEPQKPAGPSKPMTAFRDPDLSLSSQGSFPSGPLIFCWVGKKGPSIQWENSLLVLSLLNSSLVHYPPGSRVSSSL